MQRNLQRLVIALAIAILIPSAVLACLWDYDTLKMERSRFPEALELITGKFLRHSPEFYQWRIENRLLQLSADPANSTLLDDLAVAYDKTGQHDKAIQTALKIEQLQPGRYETFANLGTFKFHAGQIQESLGPIDRALKINPDAHFGREKYQKFLTEYVIQRQHGGTLKLPIADVEGIDSPKSEDAAASVIVVKNDFAAYLGKRLGTEEKLSEANASAAVKGVLGMMRFAKHDSPVLLEALGTLLSQGVRSQFKDAKMLAARAFLMASYEVSDEQARRAYRSMAANALHKQVIQGQTQISLAQVEAEFKRELAEGSAWYAELHDRELAWIRDGKNPEVEFDKLYDAAPETSEISGWSSLVARWGLTGREIVLGAVLSLAVIGGLFVSIMAIRQARMKRRSAVGGESKDGDAWRVT